MMLCWGGDQTRGNGILMDHGEISLGYKQDWGQWGPPVGEGASSSKCQVYP